MNFSRDDSNDYGFSIADNQQQQQQQFIINNTGTTNENLEKYVCTVWPPPYYTHICINSYLSNAIAPTTTTTTAATTGGDGCGSATIKRVIQLAAPSAENTPIHNFQRNNSPQLTIDTSMATTMATAALQQQHHHYQQQHPQQSPLSASLLLNLNSASSSHLMQSPHSPSRLALRRRNNYRIGDFGPTFRATKQMLPLWSEDRSKKYVEYAMIYLDHYKRDIWIAETIGFKSL